ncbi:hypothetical protein A3A93_00455 [Candidatus Roizmanbacteria bacterium RIFCSPLOWO2_01_FULL_38_12]|uniref:UPF0235 protein A3A93_00455 n=1 Tax=Candidatus Roizmanbacteria bacterium RIFCSPLOWO2_01_FULL_38_12 TaxID=1802061 RepID=A0A1F7IR25_9BACT|nr:MAG: hypothetical protein A2861_03180 [Candidatus Roizmanbacteria bacterium RIFCSPHIGHO2_01_FULL_38_15]OGK34657.1 MAG: hypothetical protein A3F59_06485 [Candidatus Roizmanbacteria bacterium RIFCSPHIGHO2_12_FULL_38_13]OGK45796.1 MAG: hypothetical protein A3A93_00455 [Candidatus Roizmanbacteria bacterium RIFCSPLOWO2_01_FULL_38_12]
MKIIVVAHPNAKNPRIEKDMLGTLHVYINQPPLEGKANKAIIESLAKFFNTKKNKIMLLSGEKSKYKVFEILIKSLQEIELGSVK